MRIKKKDIESKTLEVIKSPHNIDGVNNGVFLAGSIEMGEAIDWQKEIANKCREKELPKGGITLFDPRRDDWDSSWEQTIDNDDFRGQVEWELNSMDKAEKIVIYFDKDTQSPITLMELGLHADSKKMVVCCPEGFWRKGNVDIVCKRYNIPMVDTIDDLVLFILDEK